MRTIIAGSRDFSDYSAMCSVLRDGYPWPITTVLSGAARGADQLGERWAKEHGVPVELYPADWTRYGRSAGYRRNELMATKADALIAFWDGQSRGTKHMIDLARRMKLYVYVSGPFVS